MRKAIILFLFLIILPGVIFLFRNDVLDLYSALFQKFPQIKKTTINLSVEKTGQEIITPPPLRSFKENPQSFLTRAGVIQWTNFQRGKENLTPLSENINLNAAASQKLQDMFKKQYFGHISPLGIGAGEWAKNNGYEFIIIGENLALGNFKDDQELVQAWMDSPGHRANILNPNYQDIGVAVGKGIFEEEFTWLAVQIFGLPLSACPQPNEDIKREIEIYQSQINELQKEIDLLLKEIRQMRPKRGSLYDSKVEEYNKLVSQYNVLVEKNQILIIEYNQQVIQFNECAAK